MSQEQYPHLPLAYAARLEAVQERGEVMFVPSGWHHQVHNLCDTVSVNHNWFNWCCLRQVWVRGWVGAGKMIWLALCL